MSTQELNYFDCQVWDSATGHWTFWPQVVGVPARTSDFSEPVAKQAQAINEAISVLSDEEPGAWILADSHIMQAAGYEVMMIQLRSLATDDISVIMAVRVPYAA